MIIKYYFEYETNNKPQKPEKGTIKIDDREYRIIKTACNCRGIEIKTFLERCISELTIKEVETKLIQWNKNPSFPEGGKEGTKPLHRSDGDTVKQILL